MFPASQVPVTMRSQRLLRTPFLCCLLWAFCAPGTGAEEPRVGSSHPGSVGLDKNTVHDQEYVFSQAVGRGLPFLCSCSQLQWVLQSPSLLFVLLDIFQG